MSIKFRIPMIMFVAFVINIAILMVYYRYYLLDRLESFQQNMNLLVSETTESMAYELNGKSIEYAKEYLSDYENRRNLRISLNNAQMEPVYVLSPENATKNMGFVQVKLISLSDKTYILQVSKEVDIFNLRAHNVLSGLLYFEIIVIFFMFLIISVVIYFRYVKALLKLGARMKGYKSGDEIINSIHRQDEIGLLEASFVQLAQTIREEKQTQNRMIASISHDLKTPLTSVLGYSERIVKKDLNADKQKQYITTIYNQAKDIEAIIDEFDDYLSTAISNKKQLQVYEISYLCKMLEDEYRILLEEQKASFHTENRCKTHMAVSVDLLKLRRVFANIIGNSIRYKASVALIIKVLVEADNKKVLFRFSDNGRGVSTEDLPHIFEPFFTSDKSRRISGLGLSICRQIIESHGGNITAMMNDVGGLTIEVSLPLINAA